MNEELVILHELWNKHINDVENFLTDIETSIKDIEEAIDIVKDPDINHKIKFLLHIIKEFDRKSTSGRLNLYKEFWNLEIETTT